MNKITDEKLAKYFDVTRRALDKIKVDGRIQFGLKRNLDWEGSAIVILDMAGRYFSDAHHFKEKGDIVTAFAALNYAHGWLDAGARLGLFDVNDDQLFTL